MLPAEDLRLHYGRAALVLLQVLARYRRGPTLRELKIQAMYQAIVTHHQRAEQLTKQASLARAGSLEGGCKGGTFLKPQ